MVDNLLVSTEWLANHLNDADMRVVDIRGHVLPASEPPPHYFNHHDDYLKSHIPGAVFVDWVHEITDPDDRRHAQVAKPERFAAVMSRIGVTENTFVVAYDDADSMFAARLWWMLNYYGHSNVAVLDGGWNKWVAEGRPMTAIIPQIVPTQFITRQNPTLYRSKSQVHDALHTEAVVMDVRTQGEFRGAASRAKRKGHIPGAVNQPRTAFVGEDGKMLSPERLHQKLNLIGIDASTPEIIVYCNGGVSASYALLALKVAGYEQGAVYDGSWKEWGNLDDLPIE